MADLRPVLLSSFAPHESLAAALLAHAIGGADGSHDLAHILRVQRNASAIQAEEGGNRLILTAAVLLHDCVVVEKDAPQRNQASRLAASKASSLLTDLGWRDADIASVAHAIEAHSFSAGIPPQTLEAKILQDADRLDALGMVGVARSFYVGGRLKRELYDPFDPKAESRPLDDTKFTIDHFSTKLLRLAEGFQTVTGKRLSRLRHERLVRFLDEFMSEI